MFPRHALVTLPFNVSKAKSALETGIFTVLTGISMVISVYLFTVFFESLV